MDPKIKESVSKSIYKMYPYMDGVKPKVRKREQTKFGFLKQTVYVLTFKNEGKAADGTKIPRSIVVTVNENGKILKTTGSR